MAEITRKIRTAQVGIDQEGIRGEYVQPNTFYTVRNLELPEITPEIIDWETSRDTMTPEEKIIGNITGSVSFEMALPLNFKESSVGASDEVAVGNTWLAGMSSVLRALSLQIMQVGSDVVIKFDDDSDKSVSFTVNIGGHEERVRGAIVSAAKMSFPAGQPAVLAITLTGIYVLANETPATASPTYIGIKPQIVEDLYAFLIEGTNVFGDTTRGACLNNCEIDFGLATSPNPCAQSDKGIKNFDNVGRDVVATMTVASWTGKDAQLDEDFREVVGTTMTIQSAAGTPPASTKLIVSGNLTNKGGENVEEKRFHALELTGTGAKESEFEWTLYGLTADLTPPYFFLAANYEPTDGGSGTSPITVRGYIPMGSAGAINFGSADNYDSITINGELADTVTDKTNGQFDYEHSLEAEPGELEINIVATDKAGNTATKEINYTVT